MLEKSEGWVSGESILKCKVEIGKLEQIEKRGNYSPLSETVYYMHDSSLNCIIMFLDFLSSEGWEQLGLYDYYKEKSQCIKRIEKEVTEGLRERPDSPSPVVIEPPPEEEEKPIEQPIRRYR